MFIDRTPYKKHLRGSEGRNETRLVCDRLSSAPPEPRRRFSGRRAINMSLLRSKEPHSTERALFSMLDVKSNTTKNSGFTQSRQLVGFKYSVTDTVGWT